MSVNLRDDFVSANIPIEPVVPTGLSFSFAYVVTKAGGVTGRYKTFTSAAGVNADADLTSGQKAKIATAFGQGLRPTSIYVIWANSTTPETYDTALTAARQLGLSWEYTGCESRAAADIEDVSDWVQTNGGIYLAQSADNDWIDTAGGPATFASGGATAINTNSRTMFCYHTTDAQALDVAILAQAAAINVDVQVPGFTASVSGVTTYLLNATELAFAKANKCLVIYPSTQGGSIFYPAPATIVTYTGIDPSAFVVADWFADRWRTLVTQDYVSFATVNSAYPWNDEGVQIAVGRAYEVLGIGLGTGAFNRRSDLPDGGTFSGALVTNYGISLTGELAFKARTLTISLLAPLTVGV